MIKTAEAQWKGTLREGNGTVKLGSGLFEAPYTFASRFEEGKGTNPEELIGAAHAGCFSMFLAAQLTRAGFAPTKIHTTAKVHLTEGPTISLIELTTDAVVPHVDKAKFDELVEVSKNNCPVSKALKTVELRLIANLH
ncbi:MAG: OsmC family protein [Anaerolineae bacterium]|nr:OsmC family protein [Anaerolineae bacterium]